MLEAQHASRTNGAASANEAGYTATASAEFLKLQSVFRSLPTPYGLDGAVRFNLLFSHLYPHLSPPERRRAEQFVDALMTNLEQQARLEQPAEAS